MLKSFFYSGHEYAEDNLLFAAEVEPYNVVREQKLQWVLQQRGQRFCTVRRPSLLGKKVDSICCDIFTNLDFKKFKSDLYYCQCISCLTKSYVCLNSCDLDAP